MESRVSGLDRLSYPAICSRRSVSICLIGKCGPGIHLLTSISIVIFFQPCGVFVDVEEEVVGLKKNYEIVPRPDSHISRADCMDASAPFPHFLRGSRLSSVG